jgi:hypothetical protein
LVVLVDASQSEHSPPVCNHISSQCSPDADRALAVLKPKGSRITRSFRAEVSRWQNVRLLRDVDFLSKNLYFLTGSFFESAFVTPLFSFFMRIGNALSFAFS